MVNINNPKNKRCEHCEDYDKLTNTCTHRFSPYYTEYREPWRKCNRFEWSDKILKDNEKKC